VGWGKGVLFPSFTLRSSGGLSGDVPSGLEMSLDWRGKLVLNHTVETLGWLEGFRRRCVVGEACGCVERSDGVVVDGILVASGNGREIHDGGGCLAAMAGIAWGAHRIFVCLNMSRAQLYGSFAGCGGCLVGRYHVLQLFFFSLRQ